MSLTERNPGTQAPHRELAPIHAMTVAVRCWIPRDAAPGACRAAVRRVFAGVERRLTRFRGNSELNRLCASGGGLASPVLFRALTTAQRALWRTGGLFDPRIRADLEALGYTAGLLFTGAPAARAVRGGGPRERRRPLSERRWLRVRWTRPAFGSWGVGAVRVQRLTLIGRPRLDLGGIGKGLAVRYAARTLRRRVGRAEHPRPQTFGLCGMGGARAFLIDAGGDIWAEGHGPLGAGWSVGIEAPGGDGPPAALLRVANRAVCTSGRGRRTWLLDGRPVHHLIDPRTGHPADTRLWSVTVIGRDPAWAEVWSKVLFVAGADEGWRLAVRRGLSGLFVYEDGRCAASPGTERYLEVEPKGDRVGC